MSNPQIENGYTRISNELLEAILRAKFQYQELKILFAIMRMTYGWQKKEAQISYGALSRALCYARQNILISCKSLERDRVIKIARGEGRFNTNVVSINKNYSEWLGRGAVDNSKQVSCVDMTAVSCVDMTGSAKGVMRRHDSGVMRRHDPLNKPKENGLNKAERKEKSAVNKKDKNPQKQNLARLLKGHEGEIKEKNPSNLVILLTAAGYEMTKAWGAIVQARGKSNPAGYLISILADPKHQIADSAYEQAKLEMRKHGF